VDHVSGVARAREVLGASIHLHPQELPVYVGAVQQGLLFGLSIDQPPPVDHYYDESPIAFGRYQVRAHHAGHAGRCVRRGRPSAEAGTMLFQVTRC
jgi:glyoxylase-like metal-dependent hydrolase (beta-lactamase superfamily II)